jgi:hypothetical protein
MLEYILISAILIILILLAYIKIKYPFWNNQPVYHSYDYLRSFYKTPYVIYDNPIKTKFIDREHVKTFELIDENNVEIQDFTDLLQCHYIPSENIVYNIKKDDIKSIFTGQSNVSFLSLYNNPYYEVNLDNNEYNIVANKKIIGGISSRKVNFYFKERTSDTKYTTKGIYFIDFLCVHREQDYKTLSRKILQTHEYNQRMLNKSIDVSLIRKENQLFEGIVPLVKFTINNYNLSNMTIPRLNTSIQVVKLTNTNMNIFQDFFTIYQGNDLKTNIFDIIIIPDIGNILSQIEAQLLHVFCLINKDKTLGFYFIKNTKIHYDDDCSDSLELSGSIMNCYDPHIFYVGFLESLRTIIKNNVDFKKLRIDNLGHNKIIINFWDTINSPIFITDGGYYLYNFIIPQSPLLNDKVLIAL